MMSTFFFSFIPRAQDIGPVLPMPSWIFIAVHRNVAEGDKKLWCCSKTWASPHHGRLVLWERIRAAQPDLVVYCSSEGKEFPISWMWNAYPFGGSWSSVPTSVNKPSLSIPCISEVELDGLVSVAKVTLKLSAEYAALCCSVMIMLL